MVRFGGKIKSTSGRKGNLHNRVKSRRNVKKKPILPKKGLNQTSYESGFFDFFKIFWKNNARMELYSLTKQVANAWEALLPKPKLSKKQVFKDYSKEFKALQDEAQRQQVKKENPKKLRQEKDKSNKKTRVETSDEDTASRTNASSRSNFEEDSEGESIRSTRSKDEADDDEIQSKDEEDDYDESRSKDEVDDDESQSENDDTKSYTGDESVSEANTISHDYSGSQTDENERSRKGNNRKRKPKERKYKSYEAFLKAKKCKLETNDDEDNSKQNDDNKHSPLNQNKQDTNSSKNPEDGLFFPRREETSFDKIVRDDFNDQNEMIRKLKLFGSTNDIDGPDNEDIKRANSIDSLSSSEIPNFPSQGKRDINSITRTTDTLHVKNLVVGIRQPEVQEIFRIFLNEIILIRVLDNKFNGEAIVEFKTVEAAERAWRQMNGVEYKRLPLVLEFADKEDFLL